MILDDLGRASERAHAGVARGKSGSPPELDARE